MMYGNWGGWGWTMLAPLLWIALIGVIVWAAVTVARGSSHQPTRHKLLGSSREILDRGLASGELDADAYIRARNELAAGRPGSVGTRARGRWLPLVVLGTAVALLVASLAWVGGTGWGLGGMPASWGPGGMSGRGMGGAAVAGNGPVRSLDDAEQASARFADRWGLTVGEVMQFDNGFYAELADPSGDLATEVLVDPRTGDVQLEFGPAMMWNTAYGMHPSAAATPTVSGEQAQVIADRWLEANRPGEQAGDPEAFPGYYTLHTLRGDQVVGMLSVHAATGEVWYHAWHGRFIAMNENEE